MYINCMSGSHTLFISDMYFLSMLILCKVRINSHNNNFFIYHLLCVWHCGRLFKQTITNRDKNPVEKNSIILLLQMKDGGLREDH